MTSMDLVEAQADWLCDFDWDWYCTFTFGKPVNVNGARFLLTNYFRSLAELNKSQIGLYWALERGPYGGLLHCHALVSGVKRVSPGCGLDFRKCVKQCGEHLWRYGKAEIAPYDPEQQGAFYVSKCVFPNGKQQLLHNGEWDIWGDPKRLKVSIN